MKNLILLSITCFILSSCERETVKHNKIEYRISGGNGITNDSIYCGRSLNIGDIIDSNFYTKKLAIKLSFDSLDKLKKVNWSSNEVYRLTLYNKINGFYDNIIFDPINTNNNTTLDTNSHLLNLNDTIKYSSKNNTYSLNFKLEYLGSSNPNNLNIVNYGLKYQLFYDGKKINSTSNSTLISATPPYYMDYKLITKISLNINEILPKYLGFQYEK